MLFVPLGCENVNKGRYISVVVVHSPDSHHSERLGQGLGLAVQSKWQARILKWVNSACSFTWRTVFMARQPADLGHHLHQSLHILHYSALKLCSSSRTEAEQKHTGVLHWRRWIPLISLPAVWHQPHSSQICVTHQAFDNLQQLLHYHSDALIAQQPAHDLDVRGTQKVPVGTKYAAVGQVQGLQI